MPGPVLNVTPEPVRKPEGVTSPSTTAAASGSTAASENQPPAWLHEAEGLMGARDAQMEVLIEENKRLREFAEEAARITQSMSEGNDRMQGDWLQEADKKLRETPELNARFAELQRENAALQRENEQSEARFAESQRENEQHYIGLRMDKVGLEQQIEQWREECALFQRTRRKNH